MPRIARRVIMVLAMLSMLVGVAMAGLMVRSYWICDLLSYSRPRWSVFIETADGEFRLEHTRTCSLPDWEPEYVRKGSDLGLKHRTDKVDGSGVFPDRMPGNQLHFRSHGFALVTGERWGDYHYALFVPGWFAIAVFALLPVGRLVYWARKRRACRPGVCRRCGYDLRASSERCPECGQAVAGDMGELPRA